MPPKGWKRTDPPRMAECHPNRRHSCKGLCRSCYMKEYSKGKLKKRFLTVAEPIPSVCHPERRALTKGKFKGLCEPCSIKWYREQRTYERKPQGMCGCGAEALYGKRSGTLRCKKCYDKHRWRDGGKLRRQLAKDRRKQRAIE